MKQHITIEQYDELSEKGKKILHEWWFDHVIRTIKQDFPCLLSIGQMIEFLGDKWLETIRYGEQYNNELIDLSGSFDDEFFPKSEFLCDYLWQAVKEVLESNHADTKKD